MATREKVDAALEGTEERTEDLAQANRGLQEGAAPIAGMATQRGAAPKPGGPSQDSLQPQIQKLRELYDRLQQDRANLENTGLHSNLLAETGEIYAVDNHPADLGTEVFIHERDMALEENIEEIMRQCERALQKVEEGTYGYSDASGEFIGTERLDALPYASLTVQEQERLIEG